MRLASLASASSRSRTLLKFVPVAGDEIKGKIISARRRNQRARRVRYPERRLARAFSARCLNCMMVFGLLKERRRHRLQARPYPKEWLDAIRRNVRFFSRLSTSDQAELLGHIQVFLAEKRFEGCGDLELTDDIRVTIAAQACLLLLHRKTDYFPRLLTILIYPSQYVAEEKRQIHEHVWEEGKTVRLGETGRQLGAVVFAWDAVKSGATDSADGKNVVIHEFAHQLDFENYATDGAPSLATRE